MYSRNTLGKVSPQFTTEEIEVAIRLLTYYIDTEKYDRTLPGIMDERLRYDSWSVHPAYRDLSNRHARTKYWSLNIEKELGTKLQLYISNLSFNKQNQLLGQLLEC